MGLAVIVSHFNPSEFHLPRRNLLRFLRQLESHGIPVFAAELAYDDRPFFLPRDRRIFQFRTNRSNVLWHKENLLNLAADRIPDTYDKIAWVDPDIWFMSNDWAEQAERALDRAAVVQLFSEAWWTDKDGRCCTHMKSTMADGLLRVGSNHPGFAWAARRGLWKDAGGLCELAILGGGDSLFAAACLGDEVPAWFHYPQWKDWTTRCIEWAHSNGGCTLIPGTVVHEWHGEGRDRAYTTRHSLLAGINITESVERAENGILQFTKNTPLQLRQAIVDYFTQRWEDGREGQASRD